MREIRNQSAAKGTDRKFKVFNDVLRQLGELSSEDRAAVIRAIAVFYAVRLTP